MKKKKQDSKEVTIRFRATKETQKLIKIRALTFFEGNVSELIRYAVENIKLSKLR